MVGYCEEVFIIYVTVIWVTKDRLLCVARPSTPTHYCRSNHITQCDKTCIVRSVLHMNIR